jgi:hypothetical protein
MENISTVLEHSLLMYKVALYFVEYSCAWVWKKDGNNENELSITTTWTCLRAMLVRKLRIEIIILNKKFE